MLIGWDELRQRKSVRIQTMTDSQEVMTEPGENLGKEERQAAGSAPQEPPEHRVPAQR
jgi:hypothetical protein